MENRFWCNYCNMYINPEHIRWDKTVERHYHDVQVKKSLVIQHWISEEKIESEIKYINEARDHDLTKRKLEAARDRIALLERIIDFVDNLYPDIIPNLIEAEAAFDKENK